MSKVVDIHDPLTDICQRLGLDPKDVQRLEIEPASVEAVVYRKNDEDQKFVDKETGQVVREFLSFVVTT